MRLPGIRPVRGPLRGGFAKRSLPLRTSIGLLAVLVCATVAVAWFTIQLLKTERKALDETQRESEARAMALLSNRVEQAILAALRPPLLALKNIPVDWSDRPMLDQLRAEFAALTHIFVFDAEFKLRVASPEPVDAGGAHFAELAARRMINESATRAPGAGGLRTMVDELERGPVLIGIEPINDVDPGRGWVMLSFDIRTLTARSLQPLLDAFSATEEGLVTLQDPGAPWDDSALNWPVGHLLPGWLLVFKPDTSAEERRIRRETDLVLGITGGVILALLLATFALWRELGREHALTALRNQFVANVSHELRTPLALIRMYAETLVLGRITDAEKVRQYHATILSEAQRLTRMIDNVLDFARLRETGSVYRLSDTDLRQTVHDALGDYAQQLAARGIALDVQLASEVPPVRHDRDGVRQILINLLDNAMKYASAGGQASVRVRLAPSEQGVELSVADTGPGIAEKDHARVLAPFTRGEHPQAASGSGLGLHIVDQVVKAHKGRLAMGPAEGDRGLCVRITFPPAGGAS